MNALKAVQKTDDTLIVENYIVLFGGRDLEGAVVGDKRIGSPNRDGSTGEFFSKSTDLRSAYTNTGVLYVDWEHGFADDDEPGADDPLGFVDWTTAKADETGVRVRRILDRRAAFVRMIEPLIEEGLIGTSSEAVPAKVRKADNGEILQWPLRRDTLTVSPMEPRMLSQNAVQAIKALGDRVPALKSLVVEESSPSSTTDTAPVELDYGRLADEIAERLSQPAQASAEAADIDVEDQNEDGDAENSAPALEPETAAEPDDARLAEVLGEFVETISEKIREAIES